MVAPKGILTATVPAVSAIWDFFNVPDGRSQRNANSHRASRVTPSRFATPRVDPLLSGCEVSEVKWSEVSEWVSEWVKWVKWVSEVKWIQKGPYIFMKLIYIIAKVYTLLAI